MSVPLYHYATFHLMVYFYGPDTQHTNVERLQTHRHMQTGTAVYSFRHTYMHMHTHEHVNKESTVTHMHTQYIQVSYAILQLSWTGLLQYIDFN